MKTLKQTIESIVQENAEVIGKGQLDGVELITVNTDRQLVLDEFVEFADELAGTVMEEDTTLEEIADLLHITAIATQLTKLLGPQVVPTWHAGGFTGDTLAAVLSDLAVLLMQANYSRDVVEITICDMLPTQLNADIWELSFYIEQVVVLLKAIYLHNAPLPEVSRAFDIPTVESIETDGWWLRAGD